MINNVCIFSKITHKASGEEIKTSYLVEGIIVESIELNGPKLMLTLRDDDEHIQNNLRIKEFDELEVAYGDVWKEGGVNETENFIVLTVTPKPDRTIKINALAKPVYDMKQIADKTRLFAQRGIIDIVKAVLLGGMRKFDFGKFPVVEDYHVVAGERPSATLRQMAAEQGSHVWYCRGGIHMKKFAEMFGAGPVCTLHYGRATDDNAIIKYSQPSGQLVGQESKVRTFTGWDEKQGRIKTAPNNPILSSAKSKPTTITGSASPFILGNAVVATKPAIDMVVVGNMSLEPGQALKLMWHLPDPAKPINENLPPKVVIETVAHWYSQQKYYCRIKGAVALEPI